MNSTSLDLHATLDFAESLARQAGAVLRQYFEQAREADHKRAMIDLVTQADRQSEALIVRELQAAFPDHFIHGEEGGGYGPDRATTPFHWHVDPLDGTTNFAHRLPHFAVCLALSDPNLRPLLGVVYDPMREETFKGIRGEGATLNGRRLRVSDIDDLARALVSTGFAYDSWTNPDNNSDHVANFVVRTQGVRRIGAAALDLCYVAAGRSEVYWERGPHPWDVQAGILFVEEAGGRISDFSGQPSEEAYSGRRILASNGLLHDQAVAVLTLGDKAPRPTPAPAP
ncbi:MAG: inositol monophosphatase [Chloroflexi bacterium]|jgi:myo-inositol-1(or 4)-monophosphatase|nr:inositol monophosphatase [Chloroflexota bacterium]